MTPEARTLAKNTTLTPKKNLSSDYVCTHQVTRISVTRLEYARSRSITVRRYAAENTSKELFYNSDVGRKGSIGKK